MGQAERGTRGGGLVLMRRTGGGGGLALTRRTGRGGGSLVLTRRTLSPICASCNEARSFSQTL